MTDDAAAATDERLESRTRGEEEDDDDDDKGVGIATTFDVIAFVALRLAPAEATARGATAGAAAPWTEAPPARRGERRHGADCI